MTVNRVNLSQDNRTNRSQSIQKREVSFKGTQELKNFAVNAMDKIERKGFFAEFLIIDGISMIIPRILIGLNRDREKTGQINYKAGAEEAGREVTSGPSMFLIPMGLAYLMKKLNPAAGIGSEDLKAFSETMKEMVNNSADSSKFANVKELEKSMADKLFDKAFGNFDLESKENYKNQFVDMLTEGKFKDKEEVKKFEKLISEIHNKNKVKYPFDTSKIKLDKDSSIKASHLLEDFKAYSKDVIEKFTKKDFTKGAVETCKQSATEFLDKIKNARSKMRFVNTFVSFVAVGSFLLYLPKLYQLSKVSPAEASAQLASGEKKEGKA